MRKTTFIQSFLLLAVAFIGVSCEVAKVPAVTMTYEKAVLSTSVEIPAIQADGAISEPILYAGYSAGIFCDMLLINIISWPYDEYFYQKGYKDALNKEFKVEIVPPDNEHKIPNSKAYLCSIINSTQSKSDRNSNSFFVDIPLKVGWC